MTRAWMPTISGRVITMSAPDPREIDVLLDMPEMLARIPRFNGGVPGGNYSDAQHCCIIADAILDDLGDADAAAVGLLHDAQEFIWGDITAPQVDGLIEIETEMFGESRIRRLIAEAKARGDAAIFRACGVPWPVAPNIKRVIKTYDLRALAAERRQLLADDGRRWSAAVENAEPLRLHGGIKLWSIAKAAEEYRRRLIQLCPSVARQSKR